ncbi:MAG: hypothetical protein HYY06_06645 [Deltaproteobacteria bacterium]|nr:hypothetical protein [Deltaproteobacteria bacterium]
MSALPRDFYVEPLEDPEGPGPEALVDRSLPGHEPRELRLRSLPLLKEPAFGDHRGRIHLDPLAGLLEDLGNHFSPASHRARSGLATS